VRQLLDDRSTAVGSVALMVSSAFFRQFLFVAALQNAADFKE
jgi:hypothetical protein